MYAPLGALSAGFGGFMEGRKQYDQDQARQDEQLTRQWDMMGMQALGKAFQPQGPQPPNPGQASVPAQPPMAQGPMPTPDARPMPGPGPQMPQGPMPGAQPPMGASPVGGGPQPGPAPSQPPPGASPPGGGMPQFDLNTLVQRLQQTSPNLPPQAMMAALTRATPLLTLQGKMELAQLRAEQRQQALDTQQGFLDLKQQRQRGEGGGAGGAAPTGPTGLMSEAAVEAGAERYLKTGQLPPNLGRGVQGRADMAAIQNRAAELAKEQGIKAADLPKKWQEQKAEQVAIQRFMSGPQGNTIRSLSVVVDHLATMRDLGVELKNGNVQAFNRIAQAWAEQTGSPAPTNFNTAKQIVGAEVIKALGVAGAGTMAERQEAANAFKTASSPDQLMGAIKVAQRLLSGQVGGLKKQFITATGLKGDKFDEMLGDEAKGFLNAPAEKKGGGGGGEDSATGGWGKAEVVK